MVMGSEWFEENLLSNNIVIVNLLLTSTMFIQHLIQAEN